MPNYHLLDPTVSVIILMIIFYFCICVQLQQNESSHWMTKNHTVLWIRV